MTIEQTHRGWTAYLLDAAIAACVAVALSGCSTHPPVVSQPTTYTGDGDNVVYVFGHGWHTGFAVPSAAMKPLVPRLNAALGEAPFVAFGWGDAGFYQARRIESGLATRALLLSTESVVHVSPLTRQTDVERIAQEVAQLCLTDEQLATLLHFLAGSFSRDERGRIIPFDNGAPAGNYFYRGVGDYYLTNTCNTWTAKGLASAGMDISPTLKLTADSVMDHLRDHPHVHFIPPSRWADKLHEASRECQPDAAL